MRRLHIRRDFLNGCSGSRHFICVEVAHPIDCTTPLDYEQLYVQFTYELQPEERSWCSKQEETENPAGR